MTQKQVYDAVCDLAYDADASVEEYISGLISSKQPELNTEGLSDDVLKKLESGEKARKEAKELRRKKSDEEAMKKDIEQFRLTFPDVSAQEIPESVWEEAANGIPLSYAYAFYLKTKETGDIKAEEANKYAEMRAMPVGNDESEAPYSKEDVEKMSPSAVKNNYKKILSSIKGWRF